MQPNDPQRPVSPELKQLQLPAQSSIRTGLRVAGPIILLLGLVLTITAFAGFFTGHLNLFWLGFIGLPVIFVGSVMCQFGFMGSIARYVAGENAPVATDTVKYVAEETKGAVETVSKAAAKGVVEGMAEGRGRSGEGRD